MVIVDQRQGETKQPGPRLRLLAGPNGELLVLKSNCNCPAESLLRDIYCPESWGRDKGVTREVDSSRGSTRFPYQLEEWHRPVCA